MIAAFHGSKMGAKNDFSTANPPKNLPWIFFVFFLWFEPRQLEPNPFALKMYYHLIYLGSLFCSVEETAHWSCVSFHFFFDHLWVFLDQSFLLFVKFQVPGNEWSWSINNGGREIDSIWFHSIWRQSVFWIRTLRNRFLDERLNSYWPFLDSFHHV